MASAPSLPVPVECVNICKRTKGEGSGKYDCSVFSCASKAPRVLTGFLASTANPSHYSSFAYARQGRKNRIKPALDVGGRYSSLLRIGCKRWQLCSSSSFSSDISNEVSLESLWEDLKPTISYLPPKELELVHNALKLAFEAHDGQRRRSREPFIIHPVEVARILGELELDWEYIAAGLLHDTVEDTNVVTFQRIDEEFGPIIRRIVEG